MIQLNRFPEGRKGALTFSYDDGPANDVRLTELFRRYDVGATFHLNSKNYKDFTDAQIAELRARYAGFEISCHTVHHGFPTLMLPQTVVTETLEDRRYLETVAGYPVKGMSYPYGASDAQSVAAMRACGIVYSRTTASTNWFALPEDFLHWNPTCHHGNALALCDRFLECVHGPYGGLLFYIWGHSYEFRTEDDWAVMEQILQKLARHPDIWYASNIEIYRYVQALRQLEISVDESVLYNPSALTVWVEKDRNTVVCVRAGETVHL